MLADIVGKITSYIQQLENNDQYEQAMNSVRVMNDMIVSLDALGSIITDERDGNSFALTDTDIYNWSENVEAQFGRDGVLTAYRQKRIGEYDNTDLRLHFILYVYDQTCKEDLEAFCKAKFHEYVDTYRHDIESRGEAEKREYEKIVKVHVSTQPFDLLLQDLMVTSKNPDGQIYNDHLYCDNEGNAVFKLDTWEVDVLDAERQKEGFVCWLRNIPNKESSLCIQYKLSTELKPLFPDFIVVRKVNEKLEFYILEPHFTGYADSVPKLKGMAAYSERCTSVGRNEMLRVVESPSGKKIQTINVAFSAVRNVVYLLNDHDELNNLFIRFNDHI